MRRALVLAVVLMGVPAAALRAEMEVWVLTGSERAQPDTPPSGQRAVSIQCARNEYEAFQIVVTARNGDVKVTDLSVSDLVSADGASIPKSRITLFREHYIEIKSPSPQCTTPPGWWPDALIPFVNPLDGSPLKNARFVALPCEVKAGKNQPFWVDVFVPKETASGVFKGKATVRAEGLTPSELPIELTVWDFELPDTPTVKSHFGGFSGAAAAHKMKPNDAAWRPIEMRYLEACAAHRITPDVPAYLKPKPNPDGSLDAAATHAELKAFMERFHVNAIAVPFPPFKDPLKADREKAKRFLSEWYEYLKRNGWEKGNYIYILDEPNDEKAYQAVRDRAALVHEANKGLRVLCTEQTITSNPAWGTLVGAVDIWVPLWTLHHEPSAAERLAAGEELWSYTALCQSKQKALFWQIDFPVLNYRLPLWVNWRYGMTGLLYWSMVHWKDVKDVWTEPLTCYKRYNGEGSLFYPGVDAGFDGPVASIRLKNIREGMEDYEYMRLLADLGQKALVNEIVQTIARSWFDWEPDPSRLYAARARLALKILEGKAK